MGLIVLAKPRRLRVVIAAGALVVFLLGCSPAEKSSRGSQTGGVANSIVEDFGAERFDQIEAVVDPEARDSLGADKLKSVWSSAVKENGLYKSHGSPLISKTGEYDLFDYPLTFERGSAHLQVAVNKQGRVSGLYIRPGDPTGKFGQ